MIRKEIRADAGYSVVEFKGVRRIFAAVAPCRGVTLSGTGRIGLANYPSALSGARGFRIDRHAVGLLEAYRGSEPPAGGSSRGFMGRSCRRPAISPNRPATENCCPSRLGALPAAATMSKSSALAEESSLPGIMASPGPTLPMSIPRLRPDRPAIDRSPPFVRLANG